MEILNQQTYYRHNTLNNLEIFYQKKLPNDLFQVILGAILFILKKHQTLNT